jgi:hypothetical protein
MNTRGKTMVLPLKYVAIFLHASLLPATEIYFKNIREPVYKYNSLKAQFSHRKGKINFWVFVIVV